MTHVIENTRDSDCISFKPRVFNSLLLICPISDTWIPNLAPSGMLPDSQPQSPSSNPRFVPPPSILNLESPILVLSAHLNPQLPHARVQQPETFPRRPVLRPIRSDLRESYGTTGWVSRRIFRGPTPQPMLDLGSGGGNQWYKRFVPIADHLFDDHPNGLRKEGKR